MANSAIISRIRDIFADGKMSVIVGAGFSKNMSKKFLSWKELLKPLIKKMYHADTDDDIQDIIDRIGYLDIASEYVKRKGYHEAIDMHIESLTPVIKKSEDGRYSVWINNSNVEDADVSCHQKLLALQARNIYTFNYDNCLEIIADTQQYEDLQSNIDALSLRKSQISNALSSYTQKYSKTDAVLSSLNIKEDSTNAISSVSDNSSSDNQKDHVSRIDSLKKEFSELEKLSSDIADVSENIRRFEDVISDLTRRIDRDEIKRDDMYHLITESHELSLTEGKKNIYKLHGSIRSENGNYGFDGDRHMQYVITREDYKCYEAKHNPFVNYMKIALLKESFCIIGFSGDDPNFNSWILWVKDVLDRSEKLRTKLSQPGSSRLFFINAGDPLEPDKVLQLRNYYIEIVELSKLYSAKDPTERVSKFLDDLKSSDMIIAEADAFLSEIKKSIPYRFNSDEKWDIDSEQSNIDSLFNATKLIRVPRQSGATHYDRWSILTYLHGVYVKTSKLSELEMRLLCACLKAELMTPELFFTKGYSSSLWAQYNDIRPVMSYLVDKERILHNKKCSTKLAHFAILYQLFNFNFTKALSLIDDLKNKQRTQSDLIIDANLESIFRNIDKDRLEKMLAPHSYESIYDYLNTLACVPRLSSVWVNEGGKMTNYFNTSKKIQDVQAKNSSLQPYTDVIEYLVNELTKDPKVKPHGNKANELVWGAGNRDLPAYKVLSIFVELCLPLRTLSVVLYSEEKWLHIFDKLYEDFPYPCLFYSLQFNSRNLSINIAQKLLYSNSLKDELPSIVHKLFVALQQDECPYNFKEAISCVLPILLKGVDPCIWSTDFKKYYKSIAPLKVESRRYDDLNYSHEIFYKLIHYGLSKVADKQFKIRTIADALNKKSEIGNYENQLIIDAMSGLNAPDILRSASNNKISTGLKWLCNNVSKPSHVYVLLNLSEKLDDTTVRSYLSKLPTSLISSDCVTIKALSRYVKYDSMLESVLKPIIMESPLLWKTGIKDGCVSVGRDSYLEIADISKHILFSNNELEGILAKMRTSLETIEAQYHRDEDKESSRFFMGHFTSILDEMIEFVQANAETLSEQHDTAKIIQRINNLKIGILANGNVDVTQMIINDEVTDAINMLLTIPDEQLFPKHQTDYMFIANRIVMKDSKMLNNCLIHFADTMIRHKVELHAMPVFIPLIKNILLAYEPYFSETAAEWDLQYAEKDVFEKWLIKLYNVYVDIEGEEIEFWSNYQPRYWN